MVRLNERFEVGVLSDQFFLDVPLEHHSDLLVIAGAVHGKDHPLPKDRVLHFVAALELVKRRDGPDMLQFVAVTAFLFHEAASQGGMEVDSIEIFLGDFLKKSGRQSESNGAGGSAAVRRVVKICLLPRPSQAYVEESPLFLQLILIFHRSRDREQAILQAGDEDDGKLQPLGAVERHERDLIGAVIP